MRPRIAKALSTGRRAVISGEIGREVKSRECMEDGPKDCKNREDRSSTIDCKKGRGALKYNTLNDRVFQYRAVRYTLCQSNRIKCTQTSKIMY